MTEWTVVTVLVTLLGMIGVVAKPLLGLNATLTRLVQVVDSLEKNLSTLTDHNRQGHERLWRESHAQQMILGDHEKRIAVLERGEEAGG